MFLSMFIIIAKIFIRIKGIRTNKLLPNFLKNILLKRYFKKFEFNKKIIITGSVGKTMSTKILCNLLNANSEVTITNNKYEDKICGLITEVILKRRIFKKNYHPNLVIEANIEEVEMLLMYIDIDYILVTNVFVTTNEVYNIEKFLCDINKVICENNCKTGVLVNYYDIYSTKFLTNCNTKYFQLDLKSEDEEMPYYICPRCKKWIRFTQYHYETLGEYECDTCKETVDLKVNYTMKEIDFLRKTFVFEGEVFSVAENKIYELYNWLHALVLMKEIGYETNKIKTIVTQSKSKGMLDERFYVGENQGIILPVSNAVSMCFALEKAEQLYGRKTIFFIFDVNYQNGYLNYIYNAPIEKLKSDSFEKYFCIGKGAKIFKERLLYEDIEENKVVVEENIWIGLHILTSVKTGYNCIICCSKLFSYVTEKIGDLRV